MPRRKKLPPLPPEIAAKATALGESAFAAGIKSAPALDARVMELIHELNPTGEIGRGHTIAILDAWSRAWHTANLAAPVEGVE